VNEAIVLRYLEEIVKPYLNGAPGCIIFDDFKALHTAAVYAYTASIKLEIIHVPKGHTDQCQPLDISVMGPYKQKREAIATEERWINISVQDDVQETVRRAAKAYERIEKETIVRGWKIACPPIEALI
jgi:hypothetical protein